jgi:hypothetical protein
MSERTAYLTFLSVVFITLGAITVALLAVALMLMRRSRREK